MTDRYDMVELHLPKEADLTTVTKVLKVIPRIIGIRERCAASLTAECPTILQIVFQDSIREDDFTDSWEPVFKAITGVKLVIPMKNTVMEAEFKKQEIEMDLWKGFRETLSTKRRDSESSSNEEFIGTVRAIAQIRKIINQIV